MRQVIRLKLEWAKCHSNLGTVLRSQGMLGDPEAAHRRAIALGEFCGHHHSRSFIFVPPLDRPDNFYGNPDNVFRGIVSLNMLRLPRGDTRKVKE